MLVIYSLNINFRNLYSLYCNFLYNRNHNHINLLINNLNLLLLNFLILIISFL